MTTIDPPTPKGKLYGLMRSGDKYQAAFIEGEDYDTFEPKWKEVEEDEFYNLAEKHTGYVLSSKPTANGVLQRYDVAKQLQDDWELHKALLEEQDDLYDSIRAATIL